MELIRHEQKRIDFFTKRDQKEKALKEATERLEEFKKCTPEAMYPNQIYGEITNPKLLYFAEYSRLLETVIRAKNSLEVMDIVLEGLMRERIAVLEDLVS
jgi:hypothetical protein